MKGFIELLISRLEERIDGNKKYTSSPMGNDARNQIIGLKKAIEIVNQLAEEYNNGWIDASIEVPSTDRYILLSFSNFSLPQIGRYEEDEDGGAFYIGDDTETCVSQDLFVNAWMELPPAYKESEEE